MQDVQLHLGELGSSTGTYLRATLTHGIPGSTAGVANKTTRETTIEDTWGRTLLQETYVYTGSGYERIAWTENLLDADGHAVETHRSDGTYTESAWGCCNKDWEKDAHGTETTFSYDELDRLLTLTKLADTDIMTSYTYDAAGRRLRETRSAGGLSQVSSNAYDLAGRLTLSVDPAALETTYSYSDGGRISTVVRPGGATNVTERSRGAGSRLNIEHSACSVLGDVVGWRHGQTPASEYP